MERSPLLIHEAGKPRLGIGYLPSIHKKKKRTFKIWVKPLLGNRVGAKMIGTVEASTREIALKRGRKLPNFRSSSMEIVDATLVEATLYDRVIGEARDFSKDEDFSRVSKNVAELAKALDTGDKRWPKNRIVSTLNTTAGDVKRLQRHCK